jgi:hypothetical protein
LWEAAAKALSENDDYLKVTIWRKADKGPDRWLTIVVDKDTDMVAYEPGDREGKTFTRAENKMSFKGLMK